MIEIILLCCTFVIAGIIIIVCFSPAGNTGNNSHPNDITGVLNDQAAPEAPEDDYDTRKNTPNQPTWRRINREDVGVNFNDWRKPEALFGPTEGDMADRICRRLDIKHFDVHPEEWKKCTYVVDCVLRMLLSEVSREASEYRLRIDKFVRQGSAREGLKVCSNDEFDLLLQFSIEDLEFEVELEDGSLGAVLPEIGKLRVVYPTSRLEERYPKLYTSGTFYFQFDKVYLNSKQLHGEVFKSLIDSARESVQRIITSNQDQYKFEISSELNQPAVKIGLQFEVNDPNYDFQPHIHDVYDRYSKSGPHFVNEAAVVRVERQEIDVDIVPALLIRHDKVPDPEDNNLTMGCPRYAVFKWVRGSHPFAREYGVAPETIWRMDSSGYEKHMLDMAQGKKGQRYILTALRILKAYLLHEKTKHDNPFRTRSPVPPPQFVRTLRSYFLKQVALYCILYYRVLNNVPVSSVREALTILLDLLQICLEEKRLPHFFHTNPWIGCMFPDYDIGVGTLRYDLFHTISPETLSQAELDLRLHVRPTLEDFLCDLEPVAIDLEEKFREYIK